MLQCLYVGLGGFAGAVLRYLFTLIPLRDSTFPKATLLVNLIGSLLIGIVAGISEKLPNINKNALLFIRVGVLGGFTTFSTFALESEGLLAGGHIFLGAAYMFMSVAFCVLGVLAGKLISNLFIKV